MKEFWVFKNGIGYIEYANDISDIPFPSDCVIEEINHRHHNEKGKLLSEEEDTYYEKLFEQYNNPVHTSQDKILEKINTLITIKSSYFSNWEKNFIYGLSRMYKNQKTITVSQDTILNRLYVKYAA